MESPDEAAQIFVKSVSVEAYEGTIEVMNEYLQQGPPGRDPSKYLVRLHEWFVTLDSTDRDKLAAVIAETARVAVFECLALLDGVTGGWAVPETVSDFAVCLQTYADDAAWLENRPQGAVRINHPNRTGPDLHDLFTERCQPEDTMTE